MNPDSKNKPIALLVGGNGFLGAHLARALADSWAIRTLDRTSTQHHGIGEFIGGEVDDGEVMRDAFHACDTLVYLVHQTSSSPYLDSGRLALVRNLDLFLTTLELAEECSIKKVVFFSSGGAVYGRVGRFPVAESHPMHPLSTYGVAKASMELYLQSAVEAGRFSALVIRPSNPYGPGQNPLRRQGVIPIFALRILRGEPIEIWGDGQQKKDYVFAQDMAEGVADLMSRGSCRGAYNVGSGIGASLLDIVAVLENTIGKRADIRFFSPKQYDVSEIVLDVNRIRESTGWTPSTALQTGIEITVQWIREAGFS